MVEAGKAGQVRELSLSLASVCHLLVHDAETFRCLVHHRLVTDDAVSAPTSIVEVLDRYGLGGPRVLALIVRSVLGTRDDRVIHRLEGPCLLWWFKRKVVSSVARERRLLYVKGHTI